MRAYRIGWLVITCCAGLVGALFAVLQLSFMGLFSAAVGSVLVGTTGSSLHRITRNRARLDRRAWSVAWRVAATSVAVGIAAVGWVAAVGLPALAVVVLIAVTSPPAVQWLVSRNAARAGGPEEIADEPRPPASVGGSVAVDPDEPDRVSLIRQLRAEESPDAMSDDELCRAWQASFTLLQRAGSPADLSLVAARRAGYLDEIQRRDPDGFQRWMASGARAGSDPRRFLSQRRPPAA